MSWRFRGIKYPSVIVVVVVVVVVVAVVVVVVAVVVNFARDAQAASISSVTFEAGSRSSRKRLRKVVLSLSSWPFFQGLCLVLQIFASTSVSHFLFEALKSIKGHTSNSWPTKNFSYGRSIAEK